MKAQIKGEELDMNRTGLYLLIGAIGYGIYDWICVIRTGVNSSISQYIINLTHANPVISFIFGLICGHLFMNMYPVKTVLKGHFKRVKRAFSNGK